MHQEDIEDLAVEDLRLARRWGLTEQVLALPSSPTHNKPIVCRAVLRYALQCPSGAAAEYVAKVRKANPRFVSETEEFLKQEADPKASKP
jgi:hypothetical protein